LKHSDLLQKLGIPASEGPSEGTFSQLPDSSIFITFKKNMYKIQPDGKIEASLTEGSLTQVQIDKIAGLAQKLNSYEGTFAVVDDLPQVVSLSPLTQLKYSLTPTSTLSGIPCAGGQAEGIAYEEIQILKNPSDLRLSKSLKGIILEKGNLLSHIAITARELRIPCVMNVKNASSLIGTKSRILLNGDTGEILIL
jgi:PEP-utilising enzyme, mobile domain